MTLTYQNTEIVYEDSPEFGKLFLNKDVALGYGIHDRTVKNHLENNSDELIENIHYIYDYAMTNGGRQRVIKWTSLGVYHLGFFIKSKQAKEFRKFMSKVANTIDPYKINSKHNGKNIDNIIAGYKSQISQHSKNEQNLKDENQELRKALANITKVLDIKDDTKIKPSAHNNILEIIYQFHCHMYELNEARRSIDERIHHLNTFITSLKKSYPESEKYIKELEEKAKNRNLKLNLTYKF